METCRLTSSHLRLGVPLPGHVYDANGQLLLSKNQVLDSQQQLDRLLARGLYVEMAVFEAHYSRPASTPAQAPDEGKRFDPFLVRNTLRLGLGRLLHSALAGAASRTQIVDFAASVEACVDTDADGAIAACLLDRQDDARGPAHSLDTAILVTLLARRLGWSDARRRSAVCAALTMNVGMLETQQRLAHQPTSLTAAQREQLHRHPEASLAALARLGVDDPVWQGAVGEHHERPGGKGYPHASQQPCSESQLLRLADVFFARASARADRRALAPAQVMRTLFADEADGPCTPLVAALVSTLGLYPPGSFVSLASGEIAVVFRQGAGARTPLAAAVTNAGGVPIMQPVRRDTDRPTHAIVGTLTPDLVKVGYDLGMLWLGKRG